MEEPKLFSISLEQGQPEKELETTEKETWKNKPESLTLGREKSSTRPVPIRIPRSASMYPLSNKQRGDFLQNEMKSMSFYQKFFKEYQERRIKEIFLWRGSELATSSSIVIDEELEINEERKVGKLYQKIHSLEEEINSNNLIDRFVYKEITDSYETILEIIVKWIKENKTTIEFLDNKKKDLEAQVEDLRDEKARERQRSESKIESAEDTHNNNWTEIENLREENKTLEAAKKKLEVSLQRKEKECQTRAHEILEIQNELEIKKAESERRKKNFFAKVSEIVELKKEISNLKNELRKLSSSIEQKEQVNSRLANKLEKVSREQEVLETRNKELSKEKELLAGEFRQRETFYQRVLHEIEYITRLSSEKSNSRLQLIIKKLSEIRGTITPLISAPATAGPNTPQEEDEIGLVLDEWELDGLKKQARERFLNNWNEENEGQLETAISREEIEEICRRKGYEVWIADLERKVETLSLIIADDEEKKETFRHIEGLEQRLAATLTENNNLVQQANQDQETIEDLQHELRITKSNLAVARGELIILKNDSGGFAMFKKSQELLEKGQEGLRVERELKAKLARGRASSFDASMSLFQKWERLWIENKDQLRNSFEDSAGYFMIVQAEVRALLEKIKDLEERLARGAEEKLTLERRVRELSSEIEEYVNELDYQHRFYEKEEKSQRQVAASATGVLLARKRTTSLRSEGESSESNEEIDAEAGERKQRQPADTRKDESRSSSTVTSVPADGNQKMERGSKVFINLLVIAMSIIAGIIVVWNKHFKKTLRKPCK